MLTRIRIELVFGHDGDPADLLSIVDLVLDNGGIQDALCDEIVENAPTVTETYTVRAEAWNVTGSDCGHGYGGFACADPHCINRPYPDGDES